MDKNLMDKVKIYESENKSRLNEYACLDKDAIRYKNINEDFRLDFQRDIDKIVYSKAYTRYLGKTQVYTLKTEDHISRRSTHVQFVSRVSRTIARALGLNEDLCEAISLGHDIGHVPLGHQGERFLNELSLKYTSEIFAHNIQSIRTLQELENKGKGLNLTIQVLDGIICHNGEILNKEYKPINKNIEDVKNEYENAYKSQENIKKMIPMTLEGCVVRISDIIAYIGKDIEDAITLGNLSKEDLPKELTDILGTSNSEIMTSIVEDIIENSFGKPYISMSEKVFKALNAMKEFNYLNIYNKAYTEEEIKKYKEMFNYLFEVYLKALIKEDEENDIIKVFYNDMSDEYKKNTSKERVVIDYIAGMTDRYMIAQYNKYCK